MRAIYRHLWSRISLGLFPILALVCFAEAQEADDQSIDGLARYRSMMRKNEKGKIPSDAVMNAIKGMALKRSGRLQSTSQAQPNDAGITGWQELGPENVGGRIRSIVFNPNSPNTMYLGSVSGGVWRTDNAGTSWYSYSGSMTNLSVTSIAMDPTNPLVLYAGTGETGFVFGTRSAVPTSIGALGAGIFKSLDGGFTWTQLSNTANQNFTSVTRLSHHPTTSGTVLAATASGIYQTTNGGANWIPIFSVAFATQVKYHPTNPNIILVGTSSDFYLSTDGGASFPRKTTGTANNMPLGPGRCEGDFARTNNTIYVNVDRNLGEIWRTSDGGATWQLRNTGNGYFGGQSQGFYDNAIWVDPTNSNFIVFGGRNIEKSTDGGTTLTKIGGDVSGSIEPNVHPDIHAIVAHPQYDGVNNKTVFIGCDGGIYATTNITTASLTGGWQYLNNSLGITQFFSGAVAADGSVLAGGAQDNDRLHSTPPGPLKNWIGAGTAGTSAGGDGTTTVIDFTNSQRIYCGVANGAANQFFIGRSDDGGTSFNSKTNGISDTGLWVAPLVMDPKNAGTLVAGGTKIWKTTDRAENWTSIRATVTGTPTCSAIDIAASDTSIWVGYNNGQVSKTTDGGSNWTNYSGGTRPTTAVTSITINPLNSSVVLVTYGGYISNNVWLTEDGGSTWIQRTGTSPNSLPAIQVNTARFHPLYPNWVYIGTDLGVFASEDRGLNWDTSSAGVNAGPANVEVSQLFWQGSQYLYAATFGRGMFRCAPVATFVNINNPSHGDGSLANPFHLVSDGINAQISGTPLFILTGTYQQGSVTFTKPGAIKLWNGPVTIK